MLPAVVVCQLFPTMGDISEIENIGTQISLRISILHKKESSTSLLIKMVNKIEVAVYQVVVLWYVNVKLYVLY